jgi:hypothetical protein
MYVFHPAALHHEEIITIAISFVFKAHRSFSSRIKTSVGGTGPSLWVSYRAINISSYISTVTVLFLIPLSISWMKGNPSLKECNSTSRLVLVNMKKKLPFTSSICEFFPVLEVFSLAMVPEFYFLPSLQPPAMMPCILRALIRYETARCSEWMLIWISADIARVNECKYVATPERIIKQIFGDGTQTVTRR